MADKFLFKLKETSVFGKQATEVYIKIGDKDWSLNTIHLSEDTLNNTINGLKKLYNAEQVE